jgi:Holliday junction resolvasome RuvABC ATP-dependent DNA helicase subunit
VAESASIKIISSLLNKPEKEILRFVEPLLVELGLIERSTRGRNITQKGLDIIMEKV